MREVVDTPGTNTLSPQSFEEQVTRELLLVSGDADVVQVGDIGNLRRTLLLSAQLAEHDLDDERAVLAGRGGELRPAAAEDEDAARLFAATNRMELFG